MMKKLKTDVDTEMSINNARSGAYEEVYRGSEQINLIVISSQFLFLFSLPHALSSSSLIQSVALLSASSAGELHSASAKYNSPNFRWISSHFANIFFSSSFRLFWTCFYFFFVVVLWNNASNFWHKTFRRQVEFFFSSRYSRQSEIFSTQLLR